MSRTFVADSASSRLVAVGRPQAALTASRAGTGAVRSHGGNVAPSARAGPGVGDSVGRTAPRFPCPSRWIPAPIYVETFSSFADNTLLL
jgi:hypothetical protein